MPELGGRLRWKADHLELHRAGKRLASLPALKVRKPHVPRPSAVAVTPDHAFLVARIGMYPGEAYAQGYNVYEEVRVYPVP